MCAAGAAAEVRDAAAGGSWGEKGLATSTVSGFVPPRAVVAFTCLASSLAFSSQICVPFYLFIPVRVHVTKHRIVRNASPCVRNNSQQTDLSDGQSSSRGKTHLWHKKKARPTSKYFSRNEQDIVNGLIVFLFTS